MATKTELIPVTPAIAGQWLMRRDSNAPLDRERIARLAATITAGRFAASLTEPPAAPTHQGPWPDIVIRQIDADTTVLSDGAEMLTAVVHAGKAVKLWVRR